MPSLCDSYNLPFLQKLLNYIFIRPYLLRNAKVEKSTFFFFFFAEFLVIHFKQNTNKTKGSEKFMLNFFERISAATIATAKRYVPSFY